MHLDETLSRASVTILVERLDTSRPRTPAVPQAAGACVGGPAAFKPTHIDVESSIQALHGPIPRSSIAVAAVIAAAARPPRQELEHSYGEPARPSVGAERRVNGMTGGGER